jgi:DNA-directed RNA polymerase I, II, and III subunit RPABC1
MHGGDPLLVCTARDPAGEQVFVYFLTESKVGVKTLRRIRDECQAAECRHAILVTQDGLTPFASKELDETSRGGDVVEVFRRKELSFCVVEHELVPPHTLLEPAERKALLQRRGFKPSALPRMKASDPVARFMNFPIGGIVKIQRSIGSSDGETYYRLVSA